VHAGEKLLVNPDKDAALVTTGGLSAPSACPTVFELPALDVADISRAAPRVQARTGDSVAVAPGDYLLLEAAANAILRLRAGTYNVADVKLTGANATLAFDTTDGPVVLNVQKWSSKPLPVGLVVSAGSSRDVQINVEDGSAIKFTGALVQGNLLAPRAHVDFDEGSVLQGTVHAEHVTFGPGSRFSHHKFQEPLAIDPSCLPKLTR
jgi:hypothetical protein